MKHLTATGPLESLDEWDDSVRERYQAGKEKSEFRQYDEATPPRVLEFYRQNHAYQTHDFAKAKLAEYGGLSHGEMGIWEAMETLEKLVDDSDPDTDLTQIEHNLQTAEAIRRDGHPRWFQVTGLIHDLGKVLCLHEEPQWAVVGDTFPTGCAWSKKIVLPEFFDANPDAKIPQYQSKLGVYREGCGLDDVILSWGHDEYLYRVTRDYLPEPAQYMIRYHSCYPIHREGAYDYLLNDKDREMLEWVRAFNPYDLYSKADERVDPKKLKPYYEELVSEFFPDKMRW